MQSRREREPVHVVSEDRLDTPSLGQTCRRTLLHIIFTHDRIKGNRSNHPAFHIMTRDRAADAYKCSNVQILSPRSFTVTVTTSFPRRQILANELSLVCRSKFNVPIPQRTQSHVLLVLIGSVPERSQAADYNTTTQLIPSSTAGVIISDKSPL